MITEINENFTPERNFRVIGVEYDQDGQEFTRVSVPDAYRNHESEDGRNLSEAFDVLEQQLIGNPELGNDPAPDKNATDEEWNNWFNQPVRRFMYEGDTGRHWRRFNVPTAEALYPLQFPDTLLLPDGTHVDDAASLRFKHLTDAIGIRSRAKVMDYLVTKHFEGTNKDELLWVSLACGTAIPVLESGRNIESGNSNKKIKRVLVDIDTNALDFAEALATNKYNLDHTKFETKERNLIKDMVVSDKLVEEIGAGKVDMVDMLGFFEYLSDAAAIKILKNADRLVAEGGVIMVGNMLTTHPQLQVNQRVIGWPIIKPRSMSEVLAIAEAAGIDRDRVSVHVPEDGVYAVFSIVKPKINKIIQSDTGSASLQ